MLQLTATVTAAAARRWRMAGVAALLLLAVAARAQQPPRVRQQPIPSSNVEAKVYTFVEQMPELPGGGGMPAVVARFMRHFHPTAPEAQAGTGGSVAVAFIVTATGDATHACIVRSGGAGIDAAALRAIRSLPRFHPGRQSGVPVNVKLVLPISCIKFQ